MLSSRRNLLRLFATAALADVGASAHAAGARASLPAPLPPWFQYFPSKPAWSFFVLRLIKQVPKGGAEFNEIYSAIRQIRPEQPDSWPAAWLDLARTVESRGAAAAQKNQCVTARESFRRASNYYLAALASGSRGVGPKATSEINEKAATCFRRAASLFGPAFEWVKIPYDNTGLEGYLYTAPSEPVGVLIRIDQNTPWIFSEVLWAAEYGFSTLACDQLGSPTAARRGIFARPDYEIPVRAIIDYLEGKLGAHRARFALVGLSDLTAHYCLRAAAFEKRVAAVACIDGWYDLSATDPARLQKEGVMASLRGGLKAASGLREYSLKGILGQVKCPVLMCYTAGDPDVDVASLEKIYAELGGPKELHRWSAGERVFAHNGVDNPMYTVPFILDWLRLQLGLSENCPAPTAVSPRKEKGI
jgi:hypothetical protein